MFFRIPQPIVARLNNRPVTTNKAIPLKSSFQHLFKSLTASTLQLHWGGQLIDSNFCLAFQNYLSPGRFSSIAKPCGIPLHTP